MKVTECSIEERKIVFAEQCLTLKKDQLEQRRQEWEGQQRMLDKDQQLRIAELHRLQTQHELEVQGRTRGIPCNPDALLEVIHKLSQNKK